MDTEEKERLFRQLHNSGRIKLTVQNKRYLERFKQPRKSSEYERFRYCLITGSFVVTDTPTKDCSLNLVAKHRKFTVALYDLNEKNGSCGVELLFRVPTEPCRFMFCQYRKDCREDLRKIYGCPRKK